MSRAVHRIAVAGALALLALGTTLAATTASATTATPVPETAAIVNGNAVPAAQYAANWPFIVAIVTPGSDSQFDGQFCGGSLIDDQHVLTAAHCVTIAPGVVSSAAGLNVVANTRTLSASNLGRGATRARRVSDVFIHPDFSSNEGDGLRSDVAVLRLAEPIAGAATIPLIQAADAAAWGNGAGGVDAFAAGWGDTDPLERRDSDVRFPKVLRQTTLPLRSDVACASTVGGGYGVPFERATMFCGGVLQKGTRLGTDTCQGDSGGPLTVDVAGVRKLVGVTSWGEGCAERSFGAYARVDALRSWIDSLPGATNGGEAIGGPSGTLGVGALARIGGDYTHVAIDWEPAVGGTTPERYAVWRQFTLEGTRAEELVGITSGTKYLATVDATAKANAYVWNVRPLDTAGSNGPSATLKAGPRPDTTLPSAPGRPLLSRRARTALVVRWGAAVDRQSGVEAYQVQRRIVGAGGFVNAEYLGAFPRASRIEELPAGAAVQVRVRAFDAAGNGGRWSAISTFTTAG